MCNEQKRVFREARRRTKKGMKLEMNIQGVAFGRVRCLVEKCEK